MLSYSTALSIIAMQEFMNRWNVYKKRNDFQLINYNIEQKFISYKRRGDTTLYYIEFLDEPLDDLLGTPEKFFRTMNTDLINREDNINYTYVEMHSDMNTPVGVQMVATSKKMIFCKIMQPVLMKFDIDSEEEFKELTTYKDILELFRNNNIRGMAKNIKKILMALLIEKDLKSNDYKEMTCLYCKMNWGAIEDRARLEYFKINKLPVKGFKEIRDENIRRTLEQRKKGVKR